MCDDLYNQFEVVKLRRETYGRRLSLEAKLRKVQTFIMIDVNVNCRPFNMSGHSNAAFDDEDILQGQLVMAHLPIFNAERNSKPTSRICKEKMQL